MIDWVLVLGVVSLGVALVVLLLAIKLAIGNINHKMKIAPNKSLQEAWDKMLELTNQKKV